MGRIAKSVLLILVLGTNASCAITPPLRVERVVSHDHPSNEELVELDQLIGLPREEVIRRLGLPDEQVVLDDQYYLTYRTMVMEYSRGTYITIAIVGPYPVPVPSRDKKTITGQVTQCLLIEIGSDNLFEEYSFGYMETYDFNASCLDEFFSESELERVTLIINQVTIDIRPYSYSNHVDPASEEEISVAILSSTKFDARSVNPSTVAFGPMQATIPAYYAWKDADVNNDGLEDRMVFFRISEIGIACGDKEAMLTGQTFDGIVINGKDAVMTFNCDRAD